jgi:Mg2+ and Co2+ transporter CorA
MDYQSDDIEHAYHNLIGAKEIYFEATEHEIEAIESFENARRKAMLAQSEVDKSSSDVTDANLLDKIGNEYRKMLDAQKDKRMASYDHEIAKARMQFFRDLMDWQKLISAIMTKNAPRRRNSGSWTKAGERPAGELVSNPHETNHEKTREVHHRKPRKKNRDKTFEK